MFVKVTGLVEAGIVVPMSLLEPVNNTCLRDSVTLALVRWLAPHPDALLRDEKLRPVCPPPFGTNHALWTFARNPHQRRYFDDNLFARQIDMFPGSDRQTRRQNAMGLKYAYYDFVTLESIDTFMNCTHIDNDNNNILETITLPFVT
jgi:hypothetical protein